MALFSFNRSRLIETQLNQQVAFLNLFHKIFWSSQLFERLWVDCFLICHQLKQNLKYYQNPYKTSNKNLQID
jgi:hypothetical protein